MRHNSEPPVAEPAKRPYRTPTLIEHGTVERITGQPSEDQIGGSPVDPQSLQ